MNNALLILAGGSGKRFKSASKIPKQYIKIGSNNIIEHFLDNLELNIFNIIVIACNNKMKTKYLSNIKRKYNYHNIHFVNSGYNRQSSSKKGIYFLKKFKPTKVLIHDAARPLVTNNLIKKLINNLNLYKVCAPYIIHYDNIRNENKEIKLIKKLKFIQTPQAFFYKDIFNAHRKNKNFNAKDDITLTEKIGIKPKLILGNKKNIKLTTKQDLEIYKLLKSKIIKYGIGYDIHKVNLKSKKKLLLCGVKIKHPPLIGHSDADVGYHAICDSIFGSLSLRDIGYYFNNKNKKWKNKDSKYFIIFAQKKLEEKKYRIINLDIIFICETPKISKFIDKMKLNISKNLNISKKIISIKATTNEKIGLIGKGEAIAAQSIISIENV